MLGRDLIAILYVLVLAIALPKFVVTKFPNTPKWKQMTTTFLLLLLSSVPGSLLAVCFYYGANFLFEANADLMWKLGFSIGFGSLCTFPPFGLGWIAAVLSLIGFYFVYKAKGAQSKEPTAEHSQLEKETFIEDFSSANVATSSKEVTSQSKLPKIKTPIRRAVFLLLLPFSIGYFPVFTYQFISHGYDLLTEPYLIPKNEGARWEYSVATMKEERGIDKCIDSRRSDCWAKSSTTEQRKCFREVKGRCEKLYGIDRLKYLRPVTIFDLDFWSELFGENRIIGTILPVVLLGWLFVLGKLAFIQRFFSNFFKLITNSLKRITRFIKFGD